jgi:hypothetical protein
MAVHALPTPYRETTHVDDHHVLIDWGGKSITIDFRFGTLVDDVFTSDPVLANGHRKIEGPEFDAYAAAHGEAKQAQFRARLRQWCDTYGWCGSTWEPS